MSQPVFIELITDWRIRKTQKNQVAPAFHVRHLEALGKLLCGTAYLFDHSRKDSFSCVSCGHHLNMNLFPEEWSHLDHLTCLWYLTPLPYKWYCVTRLSVLSQTPAWPSHYQHSELISRIFLSLFFFDYKNIYTNGGKSENIETSLKHSRGKRLFPDKG